LKTVERDISITLSPREAERFRKMPYDGPNGTSAYMDKISKAFGEKLTITRPTFMRIDGVNGRDGVLTGSVVGSSARLAAELNGELKGRKAQTTAQAPDGKGQDGEEPVRANPEQAQQRAQG